MANKNLQSKLYGPFKGINKSETPLMRGLPPSPNAAPAEYATEAKNVYIDQKTGDLIGRIGIEYCDGANTKSVGGIFRYTDYKPSTGKTKERACVLEIDPSTGVPSLYVYTWIKVEVRSTSAGIDNYTFAIIEDPDNSFTKTAIQYTDAGAVYDSTTTLNSTLSNLTNIQVNYIEFDETIDGTIQMGMCDLVSPTALTYSASNATGTKVAQFWTLAKRTITNANLDLSTYIDTEEDENMTMWTAAQTKNVLMFSCGWCPVLKYDGQNLYKAGMPDAAIRPFTIEKQSAVDTDGYDPAENGPPNGLYTYASTFEYIDYKGNVTEGKYFFPEDMVAEIDGTGFTKQVNLYEPDQDGLLTISLDSLRASDGFNVKGAQYAADQLYTSGASNITINVTTGHTFEVGDTACFRGILEGEFDTLGDIVQLLILLESPVVSTTSTTIVLNKDLLKVTYIPQNYVREDIDASGSDSNIEVVNRAEVGARLEQNVKTWADLFDFDWGLPTGGTLRTPNLMGADADPANGVDFASPDTTAATGEWNKFNDGASSYVNGEGGAWVNSAAFAASSITSTTLTTPSPRTDTLYSLTATRDTTADNVVQGVSFQFEVPELLAGEDLKINIPLIAVKALMVGGLDPASYEYYISIYDKTAASNTVIWSGDDHAFGGVSGTYYRESLDTTYTTNASNTAGYLLSLYVKHVGYTAGGTQTAGFAVGPISLSMELTGETITNTLGLDDSWRWASNNLRINLYRNKGEGLSLATDPEYKTTPASMYLWGIYPNKFTNSSTPQSIQQHDTLEDADLGYLFDPKADIVYFNERLSTELQEVDYSPLPKGRHIYSFKDRLYIGADPENENLLYRSDLAYGPEYFSIADSLGMETTEGDKIVGVGGNDDYIYVMKERSLKVIEGDFTNDKLRVFDMFLGEMGCVSPRSIISLNNTTVYLGEEGPVVLEAGRGAGFLGATPETGISRIRSIIKDTDTYDIRRATAVIDPNNEHYRLFIPKHDKPSVGLYNMAFLRDADSPIYIDYGITLIYDYKRDAWFTEEGVNARGGAVRINGRMMNLASYCINTSATSSALEWALYKDRPYRNLLNYVDRYRRRVSGSDTLRAITPVYATDWVTFEEPAGYKHFLRCKIINVNNTTESALSVKGTGGNTASYAAESDIVVRSEKNWEEGTLQSSTTVTLDTSKKWAFLKCKNNKAHSMRFKLTGSNAREAFRVSAIEVEAVPSYKINTKKWD